MVAVMELIKDVLELIAEDQGSLISSGEAGTAAGGWNGDGSS